MTIGRAQNRLAGLLLLLLLLPLLTGCGEQVCSFCGQEKICREFDLLGATRLICDDCLHNPAIAVSGNVVREYSLLFENGTLEYPEGSPLRADYVAPVEEPVVTVIDDTIIRVPAEQPDTAQPDAAQPTAPSESETAPPAESAEPSAPESSDAGTAETESPERTDASPAEEESPAEAIPEDDALISDLNRRLQTDGCRLELDSGSTYRLMSGNTDLHIRFTPRMSDTPGQYELTISSYEGASSSDYAKCTIRAILSYIDSDDYDGIGHEIYNNTVQNGSHAYGGTRFQYVTHTADEVERGSADADFTISP